MIAVLHEIRSAHNVGSIFRTAEAAGCEKVFLCGITPAPIDQFGRANSKISKVALGAEEWTVWEKAGRTAKVIDDLKKEGYKIFAVEQGKKSISYHKIKISKRDLEKTALILGNELKGLPPPILRRADKILEIPMRGKKESLNVAVAFGIVAFNLINK